MKLTAFPFLSRTEKWLVVPSPNSSIGSSGSAAVAVMDGKGFPAGRRTIGFGTRGILLSRLIMLPRSARYQSERRPSTGTAPPPIQ